MNHRITDNMRSKIAEFGNFKFSFNRYPRLIWYSDYDNYINEIEITTCDNVPVVKFQFDFLNAEFLYKDLAYLSLRGDSFIRDLPPNSTREVIRINGYLNSSRYDGRYYFAIDKQSSYDGNISSVKFNMSEDDFVEFLYLFYFHFLIEYGKDSPIINF